MSSTIENNTSTVAVGNSPTEYTQIGSKREFNQREMRGLTIVAKGGMIKRESETTYLVRSSDLERWYKVSWNGKSWFCECKDFEKRRQSCKHVYAVLFLSRLPFMLMANFQAEETKCPKCSSKDLIRKGLINNKEFAAQRYLCKRCGYKFSDKGEYKGLKGNPFAMTVVADLYFKGLSLRLIEDHMKRIYSLKVSYPTIHRWIGRIIDQMKALEKEHSLNVGKRWHLDETQVRIAGEPHYIWNALDAETRILIASNVTYGRGSEEAEAIIKEALKNAKSVPDEIVTDGLKSYDVALRNIFKGNINHVSKPHFSDLKNNNLVERLNGTQKTRIRGFRRLDNLSSTAQLVEGWRLYYNSLRLHSALGNTPVGASLEPSCGARQSEMNPHRV
jgi:transposase-like protein